MPRNHDEPNAGKGDILVVDDTPASLRLLTQLLSKEGYKIRPAPSGAVALKAASRRAPDLVLLDVTMPGMSGYEVCERLKADATTRDVPVIFVSALNEVVDKVRGFEAGGVDYVTKPFEFAEVLARVEIHLTIQRLQRTLEAARARAEAVAGALAREKAKSEELLYRMLPRGVAAVLREGEHYEGAELGDITVLHCEICGFHDISARLGSRRLLALLDGFAVRVEELCARHGVTSVEAGHDTTVIVGGVSDPTLDHANAVAALALDLLEMAKQTDDGTGRPLQLRVGVHTGAAIGGVVGDKAPRFCLFGEAVDIAKSLARASVPCHAQLSAQTRARLNDGFTVRARGSLELPAIGPIRTLFLTGASTP